MIQISGSRSVKPNNRHGRELAACGEFVTTDSRPLLA
jgi:hypothetical protein